MSQKKDNKYWPKHPRLDERQIYKFKKLNEPQRGKIQRKLDPDS